MKKKIAMILAVVFAVMMFTGTIALAGNEGNATLAGNGAKRSQYMEQIEPLVQEIAENRVEIAALKAQLVTLRQQTRDRLQEMRDNPDGVTDEQIEAVRNITEQIKAARKALNATNTDMRQTRLALRSARQSHNYEAMITVYNNVVRLQEQRITQLQQLVALHQQVCNL